MSNSLNPWILDYLLGIATELGAKLYNIQSYKKKKKVQITEFLTYPPDNQEQTDIWARISDEKHLITIKFTREAVVKFTQFPGSRLTQHKGAVVQISDFKPICSRVPLPRERMSNEEFVVFVCNDVSLLGSSGEAVFGRPKGIEQHPDICQWTKGLAEGGGAGNVLKERKMEIEGKKLDDVRVLPPMPTPPTPLPRHSPIAVDAISPVRTRSTRINDTDLTSYKAKWQFLEKNRWQFSGPQRGLTEEPQIQPPKLPVANSMNNHRHKGRSRSGTPISNWDGSPSQIKRVASPVAEVTEPQASRKDDTLSSSLRAPTPAQRRKAVTPEPLSSYILGNETQMNNDTRQSSLERKVPRPLSPEPPAAEQTGPGRILVANSDTSQSQSQSQQHKRPILLGGLVNETLGRLPWMSIEDVGRILRRTAELRLPNGSD